MPIAERIGSFSSRENRSGSFAKSLVLVIRARKRAVGDKQIEGDNLGNIGANYARRGDHTKALYHYKQGLSVMREIGNRSREAGLLKEIAKEYGSLGDPRAKDYEKQAGNLRSKLEAGDTSGEDSALARRPPDALQRQDLYLSLQPPPDWEDRTVDSLGSDVAVALKGPDASSFVLAAINWFEGGPEADRKYFSEMLSELSFRANRNFKLSAGSLSELVLDNGVAARYVIGERDGMRGLALVLLRHRGLAWVGIFTCDQAPEDRLRELLGAIKIEPVGKSNPDPAGGANSQDVSKLFNAGKEKYDHYDFKEARPIFEQALSLARAGGHRATEAFLLEKLGEIDQSLRRGGAALAHYDGALRVYREIGDKSGERDTLGLIGQYWASNLDPASALGFYYDALRMTLAMNGNAAKSLNAIGNVHDSLGDHAKALDYFNRALSAEGGGIGLLLNNIARQYFLIGDHDRALEYCKKALEQARKDETWGVESDSHRLMGLVYAHLARYSKAREHFNLAIKIQQEREKTALYLEREIGKTYMAEGKMSEAFEMLVSKNQGDSLEVGTYYLRRGDFTRAREEFSSAVKYNREWNEREGLIAGLIGSGQSFEGGNDGRFFLGSSESFSRVRSEPASARAAYAEAVAAIERQRQLLPQAARTHFLGGRARDFPRLEAYEGRIRTAEDEAQAFYWSENGKARAFIETLAGRLLEGAAEIPPELRATEKAQTDLSAGLYRDLEAAFVKKEAARQRELEAELAKAKEVQAGFLSRLRREHPAYAAVQYPQPLQAGEVALNPGEVLLEYEVTDSKTLLMVLNSDKSIVSLSIPITRGDLRELVRGARRRFEDPTPEFLGGPFDPEPWAKLYSLLLAPALEPVEGRLLVPKGAKLVIVPDEILGLLPFEALVTRLPRGAQGGSAGLRFVGDDHDVAYAQSAAALTLARTLRKDDGAARGLFVLADPIFGRSDPRLKNDKNLGAYAAFAEASPAHGALNRIMGVKGTTGGSPFDRLAETGALAADLARAFGDDAASVTGKDASEARLMEEDLSRFRYIVFATHGILDTDVASIREPALVLGQLSNAADQDGFLTASEVMGLKLKTEVVALTACKTGLGRQIGGEGVMGLGRAFQYAGARNVLVSLWSVAEESTTKLTESFFRRLKEGATPREALRSARAELRKNKRYDHPFFWAPFILMGD